MSVLVIGSGGREHAICWALKKSPKVDKIYCLPGNAGIAEIAECHNIGVMEFDKILDFVKNHNDIDLTVVAPDDPLAKGLVDLLNENGFKAFGPKANAAIIESSKAFSKALMKKYGIPTAAYEEFKDYNKALDYVKKSQYPLVIKADGLALGKGVIICQNLQEAENALLDMMVNNKFKDAGKTIIIEEFMEGKEVSILAFCDGKHIKPMVSSQDHKRAFDNDKGLNTGGMGTFSPSKAYTKEIEEQTLNNIIYKTVDALNKEGREFKGVIYFGLMITKDNIVKVVEYNARFGDPETQVVLPRLESDIYDIFIACCDGSLDKIDIKWNDKSAVCVIMASGGYPEAYEKNKEICIKDLDEEILVFHAGTKMESGKLLTNGGRVLGVAALGDNIDEARQKAYNNISKINFDKAFYRKDIGIKR